MVNIPPLVFFYWAAKIGGESQMKKLSQKEFGPDSYRDGICPFGLLRFANMFTGIVETQGVVKKVIEKGMNKTFWIKSPISSKLKADQSVAHDGVCLTIEEVKGSRHRVTAIAETLSKTTLSDWQEGSTINLERCLKVNDRLDGHFVQGHIDTSATCIEKREKNGSGEFSFQVPADFASLIIEKGSIAINGISLTIFNVSKTTFDVAIIPYTFEHTNMNLLKAGQKVNIEFDMLGKYINRKLSLSK
jgi:riboflavin synthase